MACGTGNHKLIEQLLADGIQYMFGNPGTVEQGFLDAAMDYPDFKYILTLQESVPVAIADGYARATGKAAIVQLHSSPGLGNGIGMLYQAMRGNSPLVVINADAGIRYEALEAQMAADLVAIAEPVTKWATRVVHPGSLLRVIRRAIKVASTPPMGPVFVSLPMDILDAPNEEAVVPSTLLNTRVAPEPELVATMAHTLAGATHPLFIVGDGVAFSGAQPELTRLAELCGAQVWGADVGEVVMDTTHPTWQGMLGHMFGDQSRPITSRADVVLIVGTYVFPEVFPSLSAVFAHGSQVLHVDLDAGAIAKNFPVDIGVVADPKLTLGRLAHDVERAMSAHQKRDASARVSQMAGAKEAHAAAARQADEAALNAVPLHPASFMRELAARLPSDAVVFDEGLTASPDLTRYWPPKTPGSYFLTRGGSLGVGFPGAIGAKLANPDKTVIGFSGDGGSMYTIQALWTAAHHKVNVKFVVCNNKGYKLLKLNIQKYWQERDIVERDFPAPFDINSPDIRFDEMAKSMGVPAVRIDRPGEIVPGIERALAHDGPFLIDLVVSSEVPNHFVYVKAGQ